MGHPDATDLTAALRATQLAARPSDNPARLCTDALGAGVAAGRALGPGGERYRSGQCWCQAGVCGIVRPVSQRLWWQSGQDDEQDWPRPAVVIVEPDYGAELPLTSEEEGMLGWRQTGFPPQLLDRLADLAGGLRGWLSLRHGVAFAATAGRMGPAGPRTRGGSPCGTRQPRRAGRAPLAAPRGLAAAVTHILEPPSGLGMVRGPARAATLVKRHGLRLRAPRLECA